MIEMQPWPVLDQDVQNIRNRTDNKQPLPNEVLIIFISSTSSNEH